MSFYNKKWKVSEHMKNQKIVTVVVIFFLVLFSTFLFTQTTNASTTTVTYNFSASTTVHQPVSSLFYGNSNVISIDTTNYNVTNVTVVGNCTGCTNVVSYVMYPCGPYNCSIASHYDYSHTPYGGDFSGYNEPVSDPVAYTNTANGLTMKASMSDAGSGTYFVGSMSWTITFYLTPKNQAPLSPSITLNNPSIYYNQLSGHGISFTWVKSDPDNDPLTSTIYFNNQLITTTTNGSYTIDALANSPNLQTANYLNISITDGIATVIGANITIFLNSDIPIKLIQQHNWNSNQLNLVAIYDNNLLVNNAATQSILQQLKALLDTNNINLNYITSQIPNKTFLETFLGIRVNVILQ
jgi:hypothetical protein